MVNEVGQNTLKIRVFISPVCWDGALFRLCEAIRVGLSIILSSVSDMLKRENLFSPLREIGPYCVCRTTQPPCKDMSLYDGSLCDNSLRDNSLCDIRPLRELCVALVSVTVSRGGYY